MLGVYSENTQTINCFETLSNPFLSSSGLYISIILRPADHGVPKAGVCVCMLSRAHSDSQQMPHVLNTQPATVSDRV